MSNELIDKATGRYLPIRYPEEAPYWDGAQQGKLVLQECEDCGKTWFPIGPTCPHCLSSNFQWKQMSGLGTISNVVIFHKGWTPYLNSKTPYAVVQVELDEGPRITANFVGEKVTAENIGVPVEAVWEKINEEISLVQFKSRAS